MKWLGRLVLITLVLCAYSTQIEASRVDVLYQQGLDDDGNPLSGMRAYTFEAGTSTIHQLYSDKARTTAHGDFVTADSTGRFPDAYGDPAQCIKIEFRESDGTTVVDTLDWICPPIDVSDTSESIAALGLDGSAASASLGTSGDVLCKLNQTCIHSALYTFNAGIELNCTNAGAAACPTLRFSRDSASPAVDDDIGEIILQGKDDAAADVEYATLYGSIADETDGTEDGELCISTVVAGSDTEIACFSSLGLDLKTGDLLRSGTNINTEFEATEVAFNDDASLTFAHGLSCTPDVVFVYLVNTSADLNYSAGDRVLVGGGQTQNADSTIQTVSDGTNITLHVGVDYKLLDSSTFNKGTINESNWNLDVYAQCTNY